MTGKPATLRVAPVADLVNAGILALVSILALVTFTTDAGRYVPTGSVLGFQGVSHFYITGAPALVLAIVYLVLVLCSLKTVTLASEPEGVVVTERFLLATRHATIPTVDVKAIVIDGTPRGTVTGWLVAGIAWVAFLVQQAVPTLALPPTGAVLLAFAGGLVAVMGIRAWKPGTRLHVITPATRLVLRLPSPWTRAGNEAIARMTAFWTGHGMDPVDQAAAGSSKASSKHALLLLVLPATAVVTWSIVNVVLLLTGNPLAMANQVTCWAMVLAAIVSCGGGLLARGSRRVVLSPAGATGVAVAAGRQGLPARAMAGPGAAIVVALVTVALGLGRAITGAIASGAATGGSIAIHVLLLAWIAWAFHRATGTPGAVTRVTLDGDVDVLVSTLAMTSTRRVANDARTIQGRGRFMLGPVLLAMTGLVAVLAGMLA